jgi:predicted negative regulator of RcsB-dependent stress response
MPKAASAAAQKELLLAKYQAAVDAHRRHDLDEALASYQAVLELNPEIAAVHNNVAAIQLGKGNKVQAEASWRRAVSLKADYAEAHFNLAVLLSEQDGHLDEAAHHCGLAIEQKDGYTAAHHLMGNIRSSQRRDDEAAAAYAKAEAMAGGGGGAAAAAGGGAAAGGSYRWDGVEVGHTRRLRLPSGYAEGSGEPTTEVSMETLSLSPLAFLVRGFLSEAECARVVSLAYPKLKASLVMGDARATERTSTSVFLPASEDALLGALQHRLAALAQLPPVQVARSEDLQVQHDGAHFRPNNGSASSTYGGSAGWADDSARARWCTTTQAPPLGCTTTRRRCCRGAARRALLASRPDPLLRPALASCGFSSGVVTWARARCARHTT